MASTTGDQCSSIRLYIIKANILIFIAKFAIMHSPTIFIAKLEKIGFILIGYSLMPWCRAEKILLHPDNPEYAFIAILFRYIGVKEPIINMIPWKDGARIVRIWKYFLQYFCIIAVNHSPFLTCTSQPHDSSHFFTHRITNSGFHLSWKRRQTTELQNNMMNLAELILIN